MLNNYWNKKDFLNNRISHQRRVRTLYSVPSELPVSQQGVSMFNYANQGAIFDPRHSSFRTSPFGFTWFNEGIFSNSVYLITVYWNNSSNTINFASIGGITAFTGTKSTSPAFIDYSAMINTPFTVPSGGNVFIDIGFSSTYVSNGSERLIIDFQEYGCPSLDSLNTNQLP